MEGCAGVSPVNGGWWRVSLLGLLGLASCGTGEGTPAEGPVPRSAPVPAEPASEPDTADAPDRRAARKGPGDGSAAGGGSESTDSPLGNGQSPAPRAGASKDPVAVVIDAGHGGDDLGALSVSGVHEKDIALAVSRLTAIALRGRGIAVLELRTDDSTLDLHRRTELANVSGAALYLSIHANSAPGSGARGVEVYSLDLASDAAAQRVASRENLAGWVEGRDGPFAATGLDEMVSDLRVGARAERGRAFARQLHQELLTTLGGLYGADAAFDHGLRTAPFWVLADSDVPAALVELGYLTHDEDELRLRTSGFQRAAADALARATADFLQRQSLVEGP